MYVYNLILYVLYHEMNTQQKYYTLFNMYMKVTDAQTGAETVTRIKYNKNI